MLEIQESQEDEEWEERASSNNECDYDDEQWVSTDSEEEEEWTPEDEERSKTCAKLFEYGEEPEEDCYGFDRL